MDIGVAVGASVSHVGEKQLRVTLRTRNVHVHPPQRVAGLVVIEFRQVADRLPRRERMAVLARLRQRTVRVLRLRTRDR